MTTTRISHTGHNHPSTTAARTACRKAMKNATPVTYPLATVGRSTKVAHLAVLADDSLVAVRCGAGYGRRGNTSPFYRAGTGTAADITCGRCAAHVN